MLEYEYTEKVKRQNDKIVITNLGSVAHKIELYKIINNDGLMISLENARGYQTAYVQILSGEIALGQTIFRPNHDHNDSEQLLMVDDKLTWVNKWPYNSKIGKIKFGGITVDY